MGNSFATSRFVVHSALPPNTMGTYGGRAALEGQAAHQAWLGGNFRRAAIHFTEATRLAPDNASYHYGLGCCSAEIGRRDVAGEHFKIAVALEPRSAIHHSMLGMWYINQGMLNEAIGATAKGHQLDPFNPDVTASHAWALEAGGEMEEAWNLLEDLYARGARSHTFIRLFARMGRWRGRQREALDLVLKSIDDPATPIPNRGKLHLVAADLFDAMGRYDEAFAHACQGNAIRRPAYDRAATRRGVERAIAYFTPSRMVSLPRASVRSEKPVFILGMPRSGTSLVEQILASHPGVHGAGELDFMYHTTLGTIQMLGGEPGRYPECLDDLSRDHVDGMAGIYLGPLAALAPAALRITDKMPLNFYHLGMIALLLPQAKIIHCRRDAMDTCLSCHMSDFSAGNPFKYDLTDLGAFYRDYRRLMSHWKRVLNMPILEVDYETLVAAPEAESRRMIHFIGLPWDDRCLRPHETRRPTATVSVEQVRQPIYRSSVERWRRYEKFLGPLRDALCQE